MAHLSHKTRIFTRAFRSFVGQWPEREIVRKGVRFYIVGRFGRVICEAAGPYGIQKAWNELHRAEPSKPGWRLKIEAMNARCERAKVRFAEGRL